MHHFRKGCLLLGALLSYVFTFPSHLTTSIDNYFYWMFVSKKLRVSREYRELPKESKANRNTSCGHSNVPVIGMKIQTAQRNISVYKMPAPEWKHLSFLFVAWLLFLLGVKNTLLFFNKETGSLELLGTDPSLATSSLPFPPSIPPKKVSQLCSGFSWAALVLFPSYKSTADALHWRGEDKWTLMTSSNKFLQKHLFVKTGCSKGVTTSGSLRL